MGIYRDRSPADVASEYMAANLAFVDAAANQKKTLARHKLEAKAAEEATEDARKRSIDARAAYELIAWGIEKEG